MGYFFFETRESEKASGGLSWKENISIALIINPQQKQITMAQNPMKRRTKSQKATTEPDDAFKISKANMSKVLADAQVHVLKPGIICDTERRGYQNPEGRSPLEIVVDASEGFIPLWAKDMTLRWRFRERSMTQFANPAAAKKAIRNLFGSALLAWGTAVPVKFKEDEDVWDFEIVVRRGDDCDISGCVLASAFFPDPGRHELVLYPKMFTQSKKEMVETLIHEIGHVFGLRHFFAQVSETAWPSEIFGRHRKFSIMNYGNLSKLTATDKRDLKRLYKLVWNGALTHINGTPIRQVKPFNTLAR